MHGTNGGGALEGDEPIDASFTNVTFSRNRAAQGGGLYAAGANTTVTLTNCLFTKNKKISLVAYSSAAAIAIVSGANASIVDSTVIKNRGPAAAAVAFSATMSPTNTVVWQRTATADLQVHYGGVVNADHCDIGTLTLEGSPPGMFNDLGGNINADPRVRPDGTIRDAASPLIDAGTCAGAPATDFEGDPRPTGGGCDIGADEFVP